MIAGAIGVALVGLWVVLPLVVRASRMRTRRDVGGMRLTRSLV